MLAIRGSFQYLGLKKPGEKVELAESSELEPWRRGSQIAKGQSFYQRCCTEQGGEMGKS